MFSSLHQFGDTGSFEGWVRKIMVNTALQRYRSMMARPTIFNPIDAFAQIADEQEDVVSTLTAKELEGLIQQLPTAYRMVFNLYVFEGYQHKEIADILNISEGTSKSNLHDARKWLKAKLVKANKREAVNRVYLK